jgi:Protein of unknown function (DUF819)
VVDNLFALVYFPATSLLSAGLPDVESVSVPVSASTGGAGVGANQSTTTKTSDPTVPLAPPNEQVFQLCALLFVSSTLLWLGETIGGKAGALPCCTLLTLGLALSAPREWTMHWKRPAEMLGATCLYLFFATAGAPGIAIADSVRSALGPLSLYLACLYGIHFGVLWSLYRCFGNSTGTGRSFPSFVPQRLLVASSAAIGGPATAIALAQANQWPSLVVPSCLVGNIGYVIATFCGLAFAKLFG